MTTKWLLMGTGDIVRKRVADALGDNIVGICGGRERAQVLAQEHDIPEVYDDADDALARTQADAVCKQDATCAPLVQCDEASSCLAKP